jgi:integrase
VAKKTNTLINGSEYFRVKAKIGVDAKGKSIYKQFYGSSKKEAENARDAYMGDIKKGMAIDADKVIFSQLFEEWINVIHKPKLGPNTYTRYEGIHRLYIKPTKYYNMRLQDIKSLHIQREINTLQSPYTAEWVHLLLAMFFKYAMNEDLIHKSPLRNVNLPPKDKIKETRLCLEKDEIKKLMNAYAEDDSLFIFVFAAFTGLRQGEILGLTQSDINFDKGVINVVKSLKRVTVDVDNGRQSVIYVGPPKTKAGIRQVPILPALVEPLKRQIGKEKEKHEHLGIKYTSKSLLFSAPNLVALRGDRLTTRWKVKQDELEIEPITFHQLRHTFCTMLCEANVPIKIAADLMGHSNTEMVDMIYAHIRNESKEMAIQSLNAFFQPVF